MNLAMLLLVEHCHSFLQLLAAIAHDVGMSFDKIIAC